MAGVAEIAANMLASAQQRLDVVAGNVSNLSSPGFRSRRVFQQVLDVRQALPTVLDASPAVVEASALKSTGNPFDIAVTGVGAMLMRSGDRFMPVVSAQLHRDGDGRLVDAGGRALQAAGGGDIVLSGDNVSILKDGTMLIGGQAEARIGLFEVDPAADGIARNAGRLPAEVEGASVHQGAVVPPNVDLGVEMVEMTRASRIAETAARIFQIHDDLIGRVASKMAEAGR